MIMCKFCENKIEVELDNPYLDLSIVSSPRGHLFEGYNKCLAIGFNIFGDEMINGKSICSVEFVPIKYCPFCGKKIIKL